MKKWMLMAAFALLWTGGAWAQTSPKMSDEEMAVWQEFVGNSGFGQQLEGMKDVFLSAFKAQMPDMDEKCADEMAQVMQEELKDFMAGYVLPMYKKHFTLDEIKQINAFYRTPVGIKLKEKQPGLAMEMIGEMQPWQQRVTARLKTVAEKYMKQSKSN